MEKEDWLKLGFELMPRLKGLDIRANRKRISILRKNTLLARKLRQEGKPAPTFHEIYKMER